MRILGLGTSSPVRFFDGVPVWTRGVERLGVGNRPSRSLFFADPGAPPGPSKRPYANWGQCGDLRDRARLLMGKGMLEAAIALIERFLEGNDLAGDDHSKILLLLGICYRKSGSREGAIEIHERAYTISAHPSLLKELATDWLDKGKKETGVEADASFERALDFIERAIAGSERDFLTALFLKALILRMLRRYAEAHRAIDRAIEKRERGRGDGYFQEKAAIFLAEGEGAKAKTVLEEAIVIFTEEAEDAEPRFYLYKALLILLVILGDLDRFRQVRSEAHVRGGLSWALISAIQRGKYTTL